MPLQPTDSPPTASAAPADPEAVHAAARRCARLQRHAGQALATVRHRLLARRARAKIATLVAVLALSGFTCRAQPAAVPEPSAEPLVQSPAATSPTRITGSASTGLPLWELGIGVAGLRLPDYRGSDQSGSYLVPLPYAIYRGRWLRADREGARALLVDAARVQVDVSLGATVPARSNRNVARSGMPDLPGTLEIGPNVNIHLLRRDDLGLKLDLRLPVRAAITLESKPRSVGATFSPNLNLDIRAGGGWNVGLLAGPLFGDREYHGFLYDVDPAYATPERPAYRSAGGYEGWRALASTSRRFKDVWFGAFVRYDSLRGASFIDSPLVRQKDGVSLGFGLAWVFASSAERVRVDD